MELGKRNNRFDLGINPDRIQELPKGFFNFYEAGLLLYAEQKKMIIAEPWRKYALSESLLVSSVFVFSVVTLNTQINHMKMRVW